MYGDDSIAVVYCRLVIGRQAGYLSLVISYEQYGTSHSLGLFSHSTTVEVG